jgi:hypothetical protein
MALMDEKDDILNFIKEHETNLGFNETIFDILEGDLLKYVEASLKEQLSENSFKSAMERVAPINLRKKVNDKVSTLYVDEPIRVVDGENENDQALIDEYSEEIEVNSFMEDLQKGVNAYKWSVIEFYNDDGIKNRVLPSHQFLPYSNDRKNKLKVTAIIKFMGSFKKKAQGRVRSKTVQKYWIYSKDEFMAMDSDGELVIEDMLENDGINSYGVLPFVFVSKSRYMLVPTPDKDDLKMSVLFPVLLTDLNFAAKMLAHSVFYGIDIDAENLHLSPDAVWIFKSDKQGTKPEVGTITPQVSITDVITLAKEQLGSWLETKNIKAGSVGQIDSKNFASGISKVIDEADTTVERKRQSKVFKKVERSYWRVLAIMHNRLLEAGILRNKKKFSDPENLIVKVTHADQRPIMSRIEKINELKEENQAGFKSKETCIKELNPNMSEGQISSEIDRIENESTFTIEEENQDNEQVDEQKD